MITFTKTPQEDCQFDRSTINFLINANDLSLDEILGDFEAFLKAIGYSFDGHLDIIEEDGNVKNFEEED